MQRFDKYISWNANLCLQMTPLLDLFQVLEISTASRLRISGHIGVRHRGNYDQWAAWGLRAAIRGPGASSSAVSPSVSVGGSSTPNSMTGNPHWIKGCMDQSNLHVDQHYGTASLTGTEILTEYGFYRVEFWGSFHSSSSLNPPLDSNTPGYPLLSGVEIHPGGTNDPYNHVELIVEDI